MDDVETADFPRRAGQGGEMEESASHHVMGCFLVRLRPQKCNFDASGPSPVHFYRLSNIVQKIETPIIF